MKINHLSTAWLLILLAIAGTGHAAAQAPRTAAGDTNTVYLSLAEAQDYAREHNRTLQNASLDIRISEAERWKAISSMLPQVNASLDYQNYFGYKMDLGGFAIAMPAYGSLGVSTAVGISASQIISIQLSEISRRMADISLQQTEQQVTDQVKLLYYSILVNEQTVNLLKENLASLQKLYEYAQSSVDAGVSEQVDADQLLVQVATMKTSLNAAERNQEMLFNSLRLQLCIGVDTRLVLTQQIPDLLSKERAEELLSKEFVPDQNYSFQLMQQNTLLSKKQVRMAEWAYAPTLSVFHQFNKRKYFSDERTMNMTPPNLLGISLSVPIFSSGSRLSAVQSAKRSYEKQLNTLTDTEESLLVQHSQLCYNLVSAQENYRTQEQNVAVSKRVFDNISKKFEYDHASSLDVTNAGTTLIGAQSSYVQSLLEYVKASIELEQLLNLK